MEGCEAVDTIVAGGIDAVNPHTSGSGPLPSHAPIVMDIFPRSKKTRYFADMTRTVVRGEVDPEIADLYMLCWMPRMQELARCEPDPMAKRCTPRCARSLLIEDILRRKAAVSRILQAMVLAWRFMSGLLG